LFSEKELFSSSWELSYQIEPKEATDNSQCQEQFLKPYGSQPLKAYIVYYLNKQKKNFLFYIFSLGHQFPSQLSLESLATSNNGNTGSTIVSNGSIRSSPSLTSLDKMSITSNNSLGQHQQSRIVQVN
jgi:hypothetical protein